MSVKKLLQYAIGSGILYTELDFWFRFAHDVINHPRFIQKIIQSKGLAAFTKGPLIPYDELVVNVKNYLSRTFFGVEMFYEKVQGSIIATNKSLINAASDYFSPAIGYDLAAGAAVVFLLTAPVAYLCYKSRIFRDVDKKDVEALQR